MSGLGVAETQRRRTVAWTDPQSASGLTAGLSGLEIMRGIRDQELPPPPMAVLVGFRCVVAEPGEIVMELTPDQSLENSIGILHGGAAATMLDTAMGAAAHTVVEAGKGIVTLDLTLTYLRPLTRASAPIRATGKVLNRSGRNVYVEGVVHDAKDRLAVHAVGNFSIIGPQA